MRLRLASTIASVAPGPEAGLVLRDLVRDVGVGDLDALLVAVLAEKDHVDRIQEDIELVLRGERDLLRRDGVEARFEPIDIRLEGLEVIGLVDLEVDLDDGLAGRQRRGRLGATRAPAERQASRRYREGEPRHERVRIVCSFGMKFKQLPSKKVNEKKALRKVRALDLDARAPPESARGPPAWARAPRPFVSDSMAASVSRMRSCTSPFLRSSWADVALGQPEAGRLLDPVDIVLVLEGFCNFSRTRLRKRRITTSKKYRNQGFSASIAMSRL